MFNYQSKENAFWRDDSVQVVEQYSAESPESGECGMTVDLTML
jgi:hypothetical protein